MPRCLRNRTCREENDTSRKDSPSVVAYVDKVLELYEDKAKDMQATMTEYEWESKEDIFYTGALNDFATRFFIKGVSVYKFG